MFREAYRKANDAISAPDSLLDAIKAEASAEPLTEFAKPKRIWPRVVGYSGAAAAAAVLALLVFRPFDPGIAAAPMQEAKSVQMNAASVLSDTTEAAAEDVTFAESKLAVADQVPAESDLSALSRTDGDEDEYYIGYTVPDPTYADVFAMLISADQGAGADAVTTSETAAVSEEMPPSGEVLTAGMSELADPSGAASLQNGELTAFGVSFELPNDRVVCAVRTIGERAFVVSQAGERVIVSVYTKDGLLGEAGLSGQYRDAEVHPTTVFDENNALVEYTVLQVTTTFSPDPNGFIETDPMTYCPVVSDDAGERALLPEEITILDAGNTYTVYGAIEASEAVRLLYVFAELDAE